MVTSSWGGCICKGCKKLGRWLLWKQERACIQAAERLGASTEGTQARG